MPDKNSQTGSAVGKDIDPRTGLDWWEPMFDEMKSENENLRKDLNVFEKSCRHDGQMALDMKKRIEDLKSENTKFSDHNNRLLKKMRYQSKKIETMKEDWEDGTKHLADQLLEKDTQIKVDRAFYKKKRAITDK